MTNLTKGKGKPLITVGITAYNAEDTIETALNSALSQDWRPLEIIAVDDYSTDGTNQVLDRFAAQYPELHVFKNNTNRGVAESRNRIIEEANGVFIAFFDDDDESLPYRLTEQYLRIINYEKGFASGSPVICHSARRVRYPNGLEQEESTMGLRIGVRAPAGLSVAQRILLGAPLKDGYGACPTCSQMARTSTYKLINGFDPLLRRGEDTDFNIRLAFAGGHFVGLSEPLVIQTMTPSSEKSLIEEYRYNLYILEKHRKFIESEGQFEFCKKWLDVKQLWLEERRFRFLIEILYLSIRHPILTLRRLLVALHTLPINKAYSRFHLVKG